jgi:hypothetical protein
LNFKRPSGWDRFEEHFPRNSLKKMKPFEIIKHLINEEKIAHFAVRLPKSSAGIMGP